MAEGAVRKVGVRRVWGIRGIWGARDEWEVGVVCLGFNGAIAYEGVLCGKYPGGNVLDGCEVWDGLVH